MKSWHLKLQLRTAHTSPGSLVTAGRLRWQSITNTLWHVGPKITTPLVCSWSDRVSPRRAKPYVIKSSSICCTRPLYKVSGKSKAATRDTIWPWKASFVVVVVVFTRGWEAPAALIHQSPVALPFPPNCFIFQQAWFSVEDPADMEAINQCIAGCGEWDCFPDISRHIVCWWERKKAGVFPGPWHSDWQEVHWILEVFFKPVGFVFLVAKQVKCWDLKFKFLIVIHLEETSIGASINAQGLFEKKRDKSYNQGSTGWDQNRKRLLSARQHFTFH